MSAVTNATPAASTEGIARRNAETYNYQRDGFAVSPGPLLDADTVARLREHAERVLNGKYETGVAPRTNSGGADAAAHPAYIESSFAQDADRTLNWAIRDPRIAEWVAKVTGAKRLKVWGVLAQKKYPRGDAKSILGWHQDQKYLDKILTGDSVNVWIALDDVAPDTGPIRFVRRSHLWGRKYYSGIFEHDPDKQRDQIEIPEGEQWEEVEAAMPAGWVTVHHQMTLHGSGMCYGSRPRYSMVLSVGIDDCKMHPGQYFATREDDHAACPVIYGPSV